MTRSREHEDEVSPKGEALYEYNERECVVKLHDAVEAHSRPAPPTQEQRVGKLGLAYLIVWFILNVAITLYNKAAFSFYKMPYPILITAVHTTFTYGGVRLCSTFKLYTPSKIEPAAFKQLLWFSVIFTVNIWLSNASLLNASIALHQVTRATIPLFTMMISALVFREIYSCSLLPSILVIIMGVAFTVKGDLDFQWWPMFVILVGCFFSSLKGILTQKTQVGKLGLSALDVLRVICPLATVQLFVLACVLGEVGDLIAAWPLPPIVVVHLCILGLVAFGLNFTSFRVAALLNPLTLNIAGNVKQVFTSLISVVIFGGVLTAPLLAGIIATAIGALLYSHQMRKSKEASRQKQQNSQIELEKQTEIVGKVADASIK